MPSPALIYALDGSGNPAANADTYNTLAELDAWLLAYPSPGATPSAISARAGELETTSEELKKGAAREATIALDGSFLVHVGGSLVSTSQPLSFPRSGLTDNMGRSLDGIPRPVKQAHAMLFVAALEESLLSTVETGVTSEKIGPLSTTTEASGIRRVFPAVSQALASLAAPAGTLRTLRKW